MRRVRMARVTYTGENIEGVEIENLGSCQPRVNRVPVAAPLSCLRS